MRTNPQQPHHLSVTDWDASGSHLVLKVQMWHARTGRTRQPVGLPMSLRVDDEIWWDDGVANLANTAHKRFLDEMEARQRRLYLEGQDRLPGL